MIQGFMKIDKTDDGIAVYLKLDTVTSDIIRRALIMIVRVFEQRYEINKKIFLPDKPQE